MGECPDWYALFQAAKYMNAPAYELAKQSIWWRDKALIAMSAENQAQKIIDDARK